MVSLAAVRRIGLTCRKDLKHFLYAQMKPRTAISISWSIGLGALTGISTSPSDKARNLFFW